MHLIIDGDPIVYRCGFASEVTSYFVTIEDADGNIFSKRFSPTANKSAGDLMKAWAKEHPGYSFLHKERCAVPEPEENCLQAVRNQLGAIESAVREKYGELSTITTVLSGPGNYREKLATIAPYKGNRDTSHKPYWYQRIRDYLTQDYGAYVVSGREADDECSILARRYRDADVEYCVATIDKDLDQIPGLHYNYLKQVFHAVNKTDALRWFYIQCLSGDATDGVPGCYKIGPERAERTYNSILDEPNIWSSIVRSYAASQTKEGCPYVGRDPAAAALETARLVYLQQEEGELWIPTGPPHDKLPEHLDDT